MNSTGLLSSSVSPIMAAKYGTYMGLRTHRYGPPIITLRDDGGSGGNGVPMPSTGNRTNVAISARTPATIRATPRARTGSGHSGVPVWKWVISHGNSTRMILGPPAKDTAVIAAEPLEPGNGEVLAVRHELAWLGQARRSRQRGCLG